MRILNTEITNVDDFLIISGMEWFPLNIRKYVSQFEREISFLKLFDKVVNIGSFGDNFVPKSLNNIVELTSLNYNDYNNVILRLEPSLNILINNIGYIISDDNGEIQNYIKYNFGTRFLYVNNKNLDNFQEKFKYDIQFVNGNNVLTYNNLINLLFMVKNAGDDFEEVLTRNLPYMDRYTILDTGSTDNTLEIIKRVLKNKRGNLYQEPFINFRDSRNRLIELAGYDCTFNIMLDDTYYLNGDITSFLDYVRGDEYADSYSLYVKDIDTIYTSNRVFKSNRNIKYKYTLHEIPETNINVQIDLKYGFIQDKVSNYMQTRTLERKKYDLDCLFNDLKTYNNDSRTYYYIAETYLNLNDYQNAYYYYEIRSNISTGYSEEIQDSLYKMAVLAEHLNIEWPKRLELFLKCYSYDPIKPESLCIIGKYYYDQKDYNTAIIFLEKAFELDFPKNRNMNLKVTLYEYHLPKMLLETCFELKKYKLGLKVCEFLEKPKKTDIIYNLCHNLRLSYQNSLTLLQKNNDFIINNNVIKSRLIKDKALIAIVAQGGWIKWDGTTLEEKGLGGSEKWAIKYSEYLSSKLNCQMVVFCNCEKNITYNNVLYLPIDEYYMFVSQYIIDVCFVSRYVEYLHISLEHVNNVYLVNHDLFLETDIINDHPNLKGIINLSEWHKLLFIKKYPNFKNKTHVLSYGIETELYNSNTKIKYSFIYSSFANRGLHTLLQLFPIIRMRYPQATLNVFCDTKHPFVQKHCKNEMDEIDNMLEDQKSYITVHGWVKPDTLIKYWNTSHVWFYPTNFEETCCHTAYEAAASKTLVLTTDLAALSESACNGVIIPGDALSFEWRNKALNTLFKILDNDTEQNLYVERNYKWVKENKNYNLVTDNFIKNFILPHFSS